jgi:hypothetical protein
MKISDTTMWLYIIMTISYPFVNCSDIILPETEQIAAQPNSRPTHGGLACDHREGALSL